MAIKPKVEKDKLDLYRGSGKLGSEIDYLQSIDPTTYYYKKFKSANDKYLRDDMWTEASIRGESNVMINILSGLEKAASTGKIDSSLLDRYEQYENQGFGDYDTYMLALSIPTLDDTVKEEKYGNMTQKGWAEAVLNATFQRYDAEIVEKTKDEMNWWNRMWSEIGTHVGGGLLNASSGIMNWINDIYNIGEGLFNIFANWSGDSSVGDKFLWAFANDESDPTFAKQASDAAQEFSYRLAYENSVTVNAVEAYEHGYIPPSWGEMWGTGWRTEGDKVYNGWGTMWNGVTTSIGYMLPSILTANISRLAGASATTVKTLGSASMYAGIASGNISDTIDRASKLETPLSYKDLNAGSVISNAIVKASAQWAVEVLLGKILGFFSISDELRGLGADSVKTASEIGSNEFTAFLRATGRGLASAAKEGLEEALQDLSDGIIDTFYGLAGGELNEVYTTRGIETMDISNLLQSFVAGALTEGIVGSLYNLQYLGGKNRFFGEKGDGKAYKMGMFKSMNFAKALEAINDWNDRLNNAELTKEERAEAAYKISTLMQTVGSVLKTFGQSDAMKANNLLLSETNESAKREAVLKLSDTEYADNLYKSFVKSYSDVIKKYETQKKEKTAGKEDGLFAKIKRALRKNTKELKESKTTEVKNIIVEELDSNNPDLDIPKDAIDSLKSRLKALGAVALIGVDGAIIHKSDDIVFVNNKILEKGELDKILQGIAYQQVRDTVKSKLTQNLKSKILTAYRKVVGKDGTINEAIDALLFDKMFYTKVLLLTEEKTKANKDEAIEILATINQVAKASSQKELNNGNLTTAAYNTLMKKVQETMRAGLIVYCTNYARLDLGRIDNSILPADIKADIENHRNVVFSNKMDKGVSGKILDSQDIIDFDNYVQKFNTEFSAEEIANLKRKVRSTNANDRRDAYMTLILVSKKDNYKTDSNKTVYLPLSSEGIVEQEHLNAVKDFAGISVSKLIAGDYSANDLSDNVKNMICPGYANLTNEQIKASRRYNLDDKDARVRFGREVLFLISGKTLTVGADGSLLRVMDKEEFLKEEYLGKEGNTKFKQDLQKKKITKIQDVSRISLPKNLGDVPIIYDTKLGSINGTFDEKNNRILANFNMDTTSLAHEITHATQLFSKKGTDSVLGGKATLFDTLPTDVRQDIIKYISTNFPLAYNMLSKSAVTKGDKSVALSESDIIYFVLEGELQAFSTTGNAMIDLGFKWKNNKKTLVSPDGTKEWSMAPKQSKILEASKAEFKQIVKDQSAAMNPKTDLEYDAKEGVYKAKKKSTKTADGQISLFDKSEDFNNLTDNSKVAILNASDDVPLTPNETKYGLEIVKNLDIRQLTPKESFALMGVKEEDFKRIAENQSDNSLYHLAGDSIVVNVLMSIFDKMYKDGIITKPVRLIEFFAGYGSQNFALDYLGKDYESWKIAEWAIKSIQAYKDAHHYDDNTDYAKDMNKQELINYLVDIGVSMNYNEPVSRVSLNAKSINELKTIYNNIQATHNLVNIQRVTGESLDIKDTNKYDYLLTYSFPCQDLSRAGLRAGMKFGKEDNKQITMFDEIEKASETENRTRSSMLWEVDRILKELYDAGKPLPKVLLMENVTEVHNEQNNADFTKWQNNLEQYGYTNSFADLAANDYGIPQKRVRTFMVSVLNGKSFTFPTKQPLTTTVSDLMDQNADKKYYLSTDAQYRSFMGHNKTYANNTTKNPLNSRIAATLTTAQYKRAEGGNFYSDKVNGEVDLYSVLHPKNVEDVEYSNNILSKLKANKPLTINDINKQTSMFSEDKPLGQSDTQMTFDDLTNTANYKYTKLESDETLKKERIRKYHKETYNHRAAYVANTPANSKTNLKYFIGKHLGPNLQNFIKSTTADFDRLSDSIKTRIKNGTLTTKYLKQYLATTRNIKDFTFQAIAKYIYNNDEVAKLTYNQMENLLAQILVIATSATVENGLDPNIKLTPEKMISEAKRIADDFNKTEEKAKLYEKAQTYSNLYQRKDENGNVRFVTMVPDIEQLNKTFVLHYDGTPGSMVTINKIGKEIVANQEGGMRANETYGYKVNAQRVETEEDEPYDIIDAVRNKNLEGVDRQDKINVIIEYWEQKAADTMNALREKGQTNLTTEDLDLIKNTARNIDRKIQALYVASEEVINNEFIIALANDTLKEPVVEPDVETEYEYKAVPADQIANLKTGIRQAATNLKDWLKKHPTQYDALPDELKAVIDADTFELDKTSYNNMSKEELNNFKNNIISAKDFIKDKIKQTKNALETNKTLTDKIAKQDKKLKEADETIARLKAELKEAKEEKRNLREKLNSPSKYRIRVVNQDFNFTNNTQHTDLVLKLLNTTFVDTKMSKVKGVISNEKEIVANGKTFFAQNRDALLSADLAEIERTVDWFLNAKMNEATDLDYKVWVAIKGYFLTWVLGKTKDGEIYANMNSNLKLKLDNQIKVIGTVSGTLLAILNNMKDTINPTAAMASEDIELDGIKIDGDLKTKLFDAIDSGDVKKMRDAQQKIIEFVESKRTTKKSFWRKTVTLRSMSMLSSPLTWLRNSISNMILKPLHKFTDKIGGAVFKGHTYEGQLKMKAEVTKDIQEYITTHFIDNKFFDTFVTNLSKYNPSDIKEKQKTKTGLPTKEAIYANLVLKSMYNQYYNDNMFDKNKNVGKAMNTVYHTLMKLMSDDKYVREAAIRYFGKILAEHKTDIKGGLVTDSVMNDLSMAIGLAMHDYMHSNNMFNTIEKAILEDYGEKAWFAYKLIMPFASSSWNWFKAMMKMTPVGLVKSIIDFARLETKVREAETKWEAGKSQISPELTEYMIRRNLGAGVVGTVGFIVGTMLAGLGYISLEDDDYGTPKIRVAGHIVDVSSIFGSSSILAGAAFMNGFQEENGWSWSAMKKGLNNVFDLWLDDMPVMEIVEMDMYADGGFSMGLSNLQSIALSYIPNFLSYFAGIHKGNIKKDTFWQRAIAKLPGFNLLLDTKIDPYTGSEGSWKESWNRIIPFFSYDTASHNEKKSRQLGLNKRELNGTYKINGQDFNVTGKDLQEINKAYGSWNAEDLTKFYDNNMRVKVQVGDNNYKMLTYNQMDDKQRKSAVQTIMSNNAELAKIMAWTKAGNKYYGSATTYTTLRKRGITTNVYKGTKGFVKSK